ncbi:MAG TPA: transposase [Leptolyngbyaceae cyanobacterium]
MAVRRITFRLYPTQSQEQKLRWARVMHKDLYNSALSNRKTQYRKFGKNVDYYQQQGSLPEFKKVWTEYQRLNAGSLQATLKRVDFAYQRFFQGLGKYPRFKSIRHYSGWTYPDGRQGFKAHTTGVNGYLKLVDLDIEIQIRGKARIWGRPTTCTIVYRNGKWYVSITVDVPNVQRELGTGAIGIDIGCKSAVSITDGENHQLVEAPKFLRKAEVQIKQASIAKRRRRSPNRKSKTKASRRWKKASNHVGKLTRKVANQRQNWVHQIAAQIAACNSLVATEKLEVKKMTRIAKKGKRRKQKAGLNKSILDVGFGMLKAAIKYKVEEGDGQFIEVPTKKVKPSQTCPKCGHQHPKTLDERIHQCTECDYQQDRDIASAEVCLYWVKGTLPGFGTNLVDADGSSSTSSPKVCKDCGGMKQLAQKKRLKSATKLTGQDAETRPSTK